MGAPSMSNSKRIEAMVDLGNVAEPVTKGLDLLPSLNIAISLWTRCSIHARMLPADGLAGQRCRGQSALTCTKMPYKLLEETQ